MSAPNSVWLDRSAIDVIDFSRSKLSLSMLSWAYNEEENIISFLRRSKAFMDDLGLEYEHILIDDASRDRTFELADSMRTEYPQLRIIKNATNLNSGWNTRIAVQNAKNDILFWQTVDWAYDISQMKLFLPLLAKCDIVQCVRVEESLLRELKPGEAPPLLRHITVYERSDNFYKSMVSIVNYLLVRFLFRVPLLDFQNVTIYPTKLAQSIECETSTSFTNPELLLKSFWKGCSIIQVPIRFVPRELGTAKGTKFRAVFASIRQIFFYWMRWMILRRRPDLGFGSVAFTRPGDF